jgi:sugar phosphate isomerase/epimerase
MWASRARWPGPSSTPGPQRPEGLIEEAFAELGRRWRPILDVYAENGVSYGYEIHPGEDVFDGATFEMFLDAVGGHVAATINYDPSHFLLQQMDYLAFIDIYHERISSFHVKDAEFNPDGRQGVYSGYQPWMTRAGRFRSLGDGQVDFAGVFSKLTQYGYDGWAVLEWEDVLKGPEQGAREGAPFIASHLIERAEKAFDDFAGGRARRGGHQGDAGALGAARRRATSRARLSSPRRMAQRWFQAKRGRRTGPSARRSGLRAVTSQS